MSYGMPGSALGLSGGMPRVDAPLILLFERDDAMAIPLLSHLRLAGYDVRAARTAVELFDTTQKHEVALILVDLSNAAAARREFWVALDAQRRGRAIQVLTFRVINASRMSEPELDFAPRALADLEVSGAHDVPLLVAAVRQRVPPGAGRMPHAPGRSVLGLPETNTAPHLPGARLLGAPGQANGYAPASPFAHPAANNPFAGTHAGSPFDQPDASNPFASAAGPAPHPTAPPDPRWEPARPPQSGYNGGSFGRMPAVRPDLRADLQPGAVAEAGLFGAGAYGTGNGAGYGAGNDTGYGAAHGAPRQGQPAPSSWGVPAPGPLGGPGGVSPLSGPVPAAAPRTAPPITDAWMPPDGAVLSAEPASPTPASPATAWPAQDAAGRRADGPTTPQLSGPQLAGFDRTNAPPPRLTPQPPAASAYPRFELPTTHVVTQTPDTKQALTLPEDRALGAVLVEGALLSPQKLEVLKDIRRMLSSVDVDIKLGELALLFRFLSPDQLLAALLVSRQLISPEQIAALGRIKQEMAASGMDYDLASLLIMFQIMTREDLDRLRSELA